MEISRKQMAQIRKDKAALLRALNAIRARMLGDWDNSDLLSVGPLTVDSGEDILFIARRAIANVETDAQ